MPAGITPYQENISLQSALQGQRNGLGVLSAVKCIYLKSDALHLRCGMKYRFIFLPPHNAIHLSNETLSSISPKSGSLSFFDHFRRRSEKA